MIIAGFELLAVGLAPVDLLMPHHHHVDLNIFYHYLSMLFSTFVSSKWEKFVVQKLHRKTLWESCDTGTNQISPYLLI